MEIYNGPAEIAAGGLAEILLSKIPKESDLRSDPCRQAVRELIQNFLKQHAKPPEKDDQVSNALERCAVALERVATAQETIARGSQPADQQFRDTGL